MTQPQTFRESFFLFLFKISEDIYRKIFKRNKQAWQTTKADLKQLAPDTIGFGYFKFLDKNGFDILPKLENHDLFHVVTGASTQVRDELALQFYLLGNGKKSLYQYCVLLSSVVWIDHATYFVTAYKKGAQSKPFSDTKFEKILSQNMNLFLKEFEIKQFCT